ncbi:MAG: hypothetical protein KAR51_01095 [Candidatus Aenigmarchaeota archaeon]|nr:hypothetical protein [Candidatus Aenigmarchaeota archaeon]
MSKKKPLNINSTVQSNKNFISDIASIQTANILKLYPTSNISLFTQFFKDLSNNNLNIYNPDPDNTYQTDPHSIEQSILNEAYRNVIKNGLPENSCPDFLGINQDTGKIDPYELKCRRMYTSNGSGEKIPSISLSIEQFLKYKIDLTDRWDSNFIITCYLYTIDKDIRKIKKPRDIAKNMQPKHVLLIPAGYIIEHNDNFKNAIDKLGITIDDIENKNPDILNIVKQELKKTKNNAAYFTIGAKDISDIIKNKAENEVHQRELITQKEVLKWLDNENKERWMRLETKKISVSCVENGTKLDTFFNRITENMKLIEENGSIYTGIDDLLKQFPKNINTTKSTKLSQFS